MNKVFIDKTIFFLAALFVFSLEIQGLKFSVINGLANNSIESDSSTLPNQISAEIFSDKNRSLESAISIYCRKQGKFKLGTGSLLLYLARLQMCKMVKGEPWFDNECTERTFAVTKYHQLAYDSFCNVSMFEKKCSMSLEERPSEIILTWMQVNNISASTNNTLTKKSPLTTRAPIGDFSAETSKDFIYCSSIQSFFSVWKKQIYKSNLTNYSGTSFVPFQNLSYAEWFLTYHEFCDPVGCGVSKENYDNFSISTWDCFPKRCGTIFVIDMVIDGILAILIVISNALVLVVAVRTSVMRNIPGYFKISLAVSDMLVGLFVLPSVIYNHIVLLFGPLPYRHDGQEPNVRDYFFQSYVDSFGIITILSISSSIYNLCAASLDRYLSVTLPYEYIKGRYLTKRRAIVVIVGIWSVGFICAIFPFFNPSKSQYAISANDLTVGTGPAAIIVYSVLLGLPLIAVWGINIVMYIKIRMQRHDAMNSIRRTIDKKSKFLSRFAGVMSTKRISKGYTEGNSRQSPKDIDGKSSDNQQTRSSVDSKQKIKNNMQHRSNQLMKNASLNDSEDFYLARTLAIMVGAFTIMILPCIILLLIQDFLNIDVIEEPKNYSPSASLVFTSLEFIFVRLFLSNSFWNCIIYSVRNKTFRSALIYSFTCNEDKRRKQRIAGMI